MSGTTKEKTDNTPLKSKGDVAVAAEQKSANGHYLRPEEGLGYLAGPHKAVEPDLELAGEERRVFAPYQQSKQAAVVPLSLGILGLAVVVLTRFTEGSMLALSLTSTESTYATHLWLPVGFRAILVGVTVGGILRSTCSQQLIILLAAIFAAAAPILSLSESLRTDGRPKTNDFLMGASSGAVLTAGFVVLWPMARAWNWKRGTKGLLKGILLSIATYSATSLLCWQISHCI